MSPKSWVLAAATCLLLHRGAPCAPPAERIQVRIDPRLELWGVVQMLDRSSETLPGFAVPDNDYVHEARKWFSPHGSHPGVLLNSGLDKNAADIHSRVKTLLRLSAPPALDWTPGVTDETVSLASRGVDADRWAEGLRRFSLEARFAEFFAHHRDLLEPEVSRARAAVEKIDFIGTAERYARLPFRGQYALILTPFCGEAGMNSMLIRADGICETTSVAGAESQDRRESPVHEFRATAWHEIAHGVMNPVADIYRPEIEGRRRLGWECDGSWLDCVREHVAQAVMIRIIAAEYGEDAAAEQQRYWGGKEKLAFLDALIERLREYEASRHLYANLADFYPRILEVFAPKPGDTAPAPPPAAQSPSINPAFQGIMDDARPFMIRAERVRALWYLDRILATNKQAPKAPLLLRKAKLSFLLGDYDQSHAASAALLALDKENVGALLLRGAASLEQGKEPAASRDFSAAASLCRREGRASEECKGVAWRLGRPRAGQNPP